MSYTEGTLLNKRQALNIRSGEAWLNAAGKRYHEQFDALGATPVASALPMSKLISAQPTMTVASPNVAAVPTSGGKRSMLFYGALVAGAVGAAILIKRRMKK